MPDGEREDTVADTESVKNQKQIYTPSRRWGQIVALLVVGVLPLVLLRVIIRIVVPYAPYRFVALVSDIAWLPYLVLLLFACYTLLPFMMVRLLRPKLLAKVQVVYGRNASDAPMVGFSPSSGIRLFSGDTCSDFGLLVLEPGKLSYLGDTITFELTPQQIESVIAIQQSFLTQPIPRLLIGWREKPDQPLQGFTLEAWDGATLWQARARIQDLLHRLESWRHTVGAVQTTDPPPTPLAYP